MVVRTEGPGVGAFVMAVAGGKVELVVRIEFARMEASESGGAGTDFVDVMRQLVCDALDTVCERPGDVLDVADVGGAGSVLGVRNDTGDRAVNRMSVAVLTGEVDFRRILIGGDGDRLRAFIVLHEAFARRHVLDGLVDDLAGDEARAVLIDAAGAEGFLPAGDVVSSKVRRIDVGFLVELRLDGFLDSRIFDIDGVGLGAVLRPFGDGGVLPGDDLDGAFGKVRDDRLAGVGEIPEIRIGFTGEILGDLLDLVVDFSPVIRFVLRVDAVLIGFL